MSVELAMPEPTRRIEPRLHTAFDGVPYMDTVLKVPQSRAHQVMVYETGNVLQDVANEAGLLFLSDHPIWYLSPETEEQKAYYGDWVIGVGRPERVTADDVRVAIEVVTISDRRKELKDTRFQRLLNEYNGVPEFGLVFPELSDPRALIWSLLDNGQYRDLDVAPGGVVPVHAIPGLELKVKARSEWGDGRKIEVYYRGERRFPLPEERVRAESEKARAESEKARAESEKARAESEKARAERLAAKLRAAGIDPNGDE